MPVYTYRCDNCGHEFDQQQSFADKPLKICPNCKKHALNKVYKAAGVVFKGSGFYVTDKKKSSTASSTNGTSKPKETTAKDKTEAKPETKSEKKNSESKPATKSSE
jgi:putative FmdB family regulatory protein